jgi:hypothetical protein
MAEILFVNGLRKTVEPKNGKDFKLEELHDIVGGYIECIYLPGKMLMVLDEEGKLKGKDVNQNATEMARLNNDYIVGDVLVCKKSEVK